MTEQPAYQYAKMLGFTEEEAKALQACKDGAGASQENILRIARVKGLPSTKEVYPIPPPEPAPDEPQSPTGYGVPVMSGKLPAKPKTRRTRRVKKG